MEVKISVTPEFKRRLKPLSKKYPSMPNDLKELQKSLVKDPTQGSDLGNGVRKVRMAIASKGKGKSGGARVITLLTQATAENTDIKLLTIYDKSDISNISDNYLEFLIKEANEQLSK